MLVENKYFNDVEQLNIINGKLEIPCNTERLGKYNFEGNSEIREVTLPSNINVIEEGTFQNCVNLETVTMKCITPVRIEKDAFKGCISLKNIHINKISFIGYEAFEGCQQIKSVNFAYKYELNDKAFNNCTKLETIKIPKMTSSYKKDIYGAVELVKPTCRILDGCTNLKAIKYFKENEYNAYTEGAQLNKMSVILPSGFSGYICRVPEECMEMTEDTKIAVKDGKIIINQDDVYNDIEASEATIEGASYIYNASCAMNDNLQILTIGKRVRTIGKYAFADCANLQKVSMKSGVKEINDYAFLRCKNLTEASLPEGLRNIGVGVFKNCISLKNVKIKDGIRVLDLSIFEDCNELEELQIPENVIITGESALIKCDKLIIKKVRKGRVKEEYKVSAEGLVLQKNGKTENKLVEQKPKWRFPFNIFRRFFGRNK